MESLVGKVKNYIESEKYAELSECLKESIDQLHKNWNILDGVIDSLDLQDHTIAVAFLLAAKFECANTTNTDVMQLSNILQDFLDNLNDIDLQRALIPFYMLCHHYTKFIICQPFSLSCINLLVDAVVKVRRNVSRLTPVHSDLCQLCLKAQHYEAALPLLAIDITEISTGSELLPKDKEKSVSEMNEDAKYCLQYFYYGGMIYTAIKNFERAIYFYDLCLTIPALTMSHIMLEAYKKYILVSLLLRGRLVPPSKRSSHILTRYMKPASLVYHDLVTAFSSLNSERLNAVVTKNVEIYKRDGNFGLVKQLEIALYKYNIHRLTKTFLTLSLDDVAEKVQLPSADEAEWYIFSMVKTGEIYASINRIDGRVVFHECPERFNTVQRYVNMQEMINEASDWIKQLNKMDEKIALNPEYIEKMSSESDDASSTKGYTTSSDQSDDS